MRLSFFLVPLLVAGLPAPPAVAQTSSASGPAAAAAEVWRLRAGDMVRIEVGDERALNGQFGVTEDGIALLPLIGRVRVAGRPFPEVRTDILEAYGARLVEMPVVVTPVLRIAVLGEVRAPGLVQVDPTFTVADVLAAAGGITPLGNPSRITLTGERGQVRFSLSDDEAVLARSLRPGDQIVVPRQGWARQNLNVLLGAAASVLAAAVTTLIIQAGQ